MTRTKGKLAFIVNNNVRKKTLVKRKASIVKKLNELTTLCDVEACAIITSPFDNQPTVWPSMEGAKEVIEKFNKLPDIEREKKKVNQETYLKQRLEKMEEKLKKQRAKNRQMELTQMMFQGMRGSLPLQSKEDYEDLNKFINQYMMDIEGMMAIRHNAGSSSTFVPPSND